MNGKERKKERRSLQLSPINHYNWKSIDPPLPPQKKTYYDPHSLPIYGILILSQ